MPKAIGESVVVIVGASSGIGRATALMLARRGVRGLVVAARREAPLRTLARECEALGARAVPVQADVTDEDAMARLASRAVEAFGRFDAWVHAASVAAFGRFDETPSEVFRRVVETNLVGVANGARVALPELRANGGGVLVTVASILGKASVPYLSAYNASKFGVVGLSESLRTEIDDEDVHVSTVLPPPTDTPFYAHAANFTGREVRPPPPVYDADDVAEAIVGCLESPEREVHVGGATRLQNVLHAFIPETYERAAGAYTERALFTDRRRAATNGNVFEPVPEGTGVSGGWRGEAARERRG